MFNARWIEETGTLTLCSSASDEHNLTGLDALFVKNLLLASVEDDDDMEEAFLKGEEVFFSDMVVTQPAKKGKRRISKVVDDDDEDDGFHDEDDEDDDEDGDNADETFPLEDARDIAIDTIEDQLQEAAAAISSAQHALTKLKKSNSTK